MNNYYLINVHLPLNLSNSYTYKVNDTTTVNIGDIVLVPLKQKLIYGIVTEINITSNLLPEKIKFINKPVTSIFSLNKSLINFLHWVSGYTISNFGNVLKMAINVSGFNFNNQDEFLEINNNASLSKITTKRKEIIDFIKQHQPILKSHVLNKFNKSSVVNLLIKEQIINTVYYPKKYTMQDNIKYNPITLNNTQVEVCRGIDKYLNQDLFNVLVLYGVPGSGKTEVYFNAINTVIKKNKQVLILLPEIALSNQLVNSFKQRFGVNAFVWHSDISTANKQEVFLAANNGDLKVIIGARSSLFLPFKDLGLIIVDEEHDSSFKQEDGIIYNAKDMAIVRAKITNIPILLVSATPSLETINNINNNKFIKFSLPSKFNNISLPDIEIVNMQEQSSILSSQLINEINNTLSNKQQVLLFVNRRGYSAVAYCKSCHENIVCKNCAVNMVYHKHINTLMCHYCGYKVILNGLDCNLCLSKNSIVFVGTGVEKVEEVVKEQFNCNSIILSSDTLSSNAKRNVIFNDIINNKYNILIGTQIVAKGYNFPNLTLVGIIDADSMSSIDLKAKEKTWQLLYQVAGRAGRFTTNAKVILQTYKKNNFLIEYLIKKDYNLFIEKVIEDKKQNLIPPFAKWVALIVSCQNKNLLLKFCYYLADINVRNSNYEVMGPIEAPIAFLRGFYRQRFLVKAKNNVNIQAVIKNWLSEVNLPSQIKLQIDVDPVSFY